MLAQETIIAFNHACSRPFLLSAFFVWVGIAVDQKFLCTQIRRVEYHKFERRMNKLT